MNSILPGKEFYKAFLEKLISLFISVKLYIINLSAVMLYLGKLESSGFTAIVCSVAAVKVGTDMITIYKNNKESNTDE